MAESQANGEPADQSNGQKNLILVCVDCREEFVFPTSAQRYFEEKGFTHTPKRCKACHGRYRHQQELEKENPSHGHNHSSDEHSKPNRAPTKASG